MLEIQRSSETNDNLNESPRFDWLCALLNSRYTRIFAFLLLAMGSADCASERIHLRQDQCDDYRARTHRNSDGTHGFDEIVVFPLNSTKEFRCAIKPECRKLGKDEKKPEPKDCIDWSKPCVEL